jgi:hypothetical protein
MTCLILSPRAPLTGLSWNLYDKGSPGNFAEVTIQCQPEIKGSCYIRNQYRFESPSRHSQDSSPSPESSFKAQIHTFRRNHVPDSVHQGASSFM